MDQRITKICAEPTAETRTNLDNEQTVHVLHVDDDEDFLVASKRFLKKYGVFQIDFAASVKDALKKLEQQRYDVIISDYRLPDMNGLEFLKQLRTARNYVPFILFTGQDRDTIAIEALSSGADRCFSKNQNPETLYFEVAYSLRKAVNAKRAEEELCRHICLLEKVTHNLDVGLVMISKDYRILWTNQKQELCGTGCMNKKCHVSLHKRESICPDCGVKEVFETGKDRVVTEKAVKTKNGEDTWIEIVTTPIRDKAGNITAALELVTRIDEQKSAWDSLEQTMNELVLINEKLGVVGRLTRHDSRNKLSVILNNAYLLKQKLQDNSGALEYLEAIETAVEHVEEIFSFAKDYEMLGIEELSYFNVEKTVNEAVAVISNMEDAKLVNECRGLIVMADSLLRQLFYNLIQNSLRHGETVSQIRIHCKKVENDHVELIYEDNGVGILLTEKEKIFKEGYGKGTGYGLYLIRKICEEYDWKIQETGTPRKGACFVITIPKTNKNGDMSYRFEK